MARFLGLILALLASASAKADTEYAYPKFIGCPAYEAALQNCLNSVAQFPGYCFDLRSSGTSGIWQHKYNNGQSNWNQFVYVCNNWQPPQCDHEPGTVLVSGVSMDLDIEAANGCVGHCGIKYVRKKTAICFGNVCIGEVEGQSTGQLCGVTEPTPNGPPVHEEAEEECRDVGGGYVQCSDGDDVCVSKNGKKWCWTIENNESDPPLIESPKCKYTGRDGACVEPDKPPMDWEKSSHFAFSRKSSSGPRQPIIVATYRNRNISGNDGSDGNDGGDGDDGNDGSDGEDGEDADEDDNGSASGNCASGFTCSGDALLCAIGRRTHNTHCQVASLQEADSEYRKGRQARGGETCHSGPPACAGDEVDCMVATQTWAVRCAGVINNGGDCEAGTPPSCAGDSIGCYQATQLWRLGCAEDSDGSDNGVVGGQSCDAPPQCQADNVGCSALLQSWELRCAKWEHGMHDLDPDGQGTGSGEGAITSRIIGPGDLDMSGYIGGSCPVFPPMSIGGYSWAIDSTLWCDFLSIIHGCMVLLGAIWAGRILLET